MSADTMPCGCLGHADYEDMCRYPALERQLAKERMEEKARLREYEETVRDRDAWKVRAEQAERERDEARRSLAFSDGVLKATEGQRNRAVADNAALATHLSDVEGFLHRDDAADAIREYMARHRDTDVTKTGAALLEYVRALEAVRAAVEPTRRLTELLLASEHGHHATETERAMVDACARADALKSQPARQYVDAEKVREVLTAPQPSTKRHWLNDRQECSDECPACWENMARGFNPDGTGPQS